jgi:hypothetical protein
LRPPLCMESIYTHSFIITISLPYCVAKTKRIELPVIYLRWLAGCSQGESRKLKEQRDDAVMELRRMQGRDLGGLDLERLEATETAIKEALQRVSREKERVIKERLDGESVSYLLG